MFSLFVVDKTDGCRLICYDAGLYDNFSVGRSYKFTGLRIKLPYTPPNHSGSASEGRFELLLDSGASWVEIDFVSSQQPPMSRTAEIRQMAQDTIVNVEVCILKVENTQNVKPSYSDTEKQLRNVRVADQSKVEIDVTLWDVLAKEEWEPQTWIRILSGRLKIFQRQHRISTNFHTFVNRIKRPKNAPELSLSQSSPDNVPIVPDATIVCAIESSSDLILYGRCPSCQKHMALAQSDAKREVCIKHDVPACSKWFPTRNIKFGVRCRVSLSEVQADETCNSIGEYMAFDDICAEIFGTSIKEIQQQCDNMKQLMCRAFGRKFTMRLNHRQKKIVFAKELKDLIDEL